ncbi:LysR family transcriptional regulator [Sulfidibacter corallicola]|uniref:LysR family transcriptional regulator n=1 Tax=Sulfidibacter corallicola TaxID=2818388 RepID=A0A8A4TRA9_SULCO|nr:LysR family transcriptional regulator [Sulfidibacter corallicola]QTD49065.1 LysR family transcriptional regulator [Sulfidibacter corallicola]
MRDLNDMIVFAKVVEAGGFSAAGRLLQLPTSNISRRVARLEVSLDARLLERTTRRMRLTELGRIYYEHCRRIMEEADQAEQSVSMHRGTPMGLLRVSASVTTGIHLISPLLTEYLEAYPEVKVDLNLTNRRVDLIEEGFDVVIRVGSLPDSNLTAKYLGETNLYLWAAPGIMGELGVPEVPADLARFQVLCMSDSGFSASWTLEGPAGTETVPLQPRAFVNDFTAMRQLLLDGAGIGFLPGYMCTEMEERGHLVRVLPEWHLPPVVFHALFTGQRGAVPKVRTFLDLIVRKLHPEKACET